MKKNTIFYLFAFFLFLSSGYSQEKLQYPVSKKVDQQDNYFGTIVSDPYRWLEETGSPETKEWVEAQNKVTFDYLGKIPFREKIKDRLMEIWNYPKYSGPFKDGNNYFFYKNDGLQNQSVLYIQKGINSEPEVFLDPNKLSEDGTAALMGTEISNDGKYMAYYVSKSGSDWREIYVMDIATKQVMKDHITQVKFSGASWYKDGFFYGWYDNTKYENELTRKNEFQKLYYHKLGTEQSSDILVYEDKTNPGRSAYMGASEDEKYIFLYIYEQGKRGYQLLFKKSLFTKDAFVPVSENMDYKYSVQGVFGSKAYLFTNDNAPNGKIISIDLNNPSGPRETVIAEKEEPLEDINLIGGKIIIKYMKDVTDRVYAYGLDGKLLHEIQLPSIGNVKGFNGKKEDNLTFYTFTSMTSPPAIYIYDTEKNESRLFKASEVKYNPEDYATKQVFYTSKDGTKIPMFIVFKNGTHLNGNNPTLLYSYGGFNVNMTPSFSLTRLILLENGGIYALPCIRGGGEYGEKWHEAGMLGNKQNVYDDFIAAAEYLINEKYTSPEKLAIMGGSNGGLLVGAVMNQRPELFRVAFPAVGVMDMLRFHKFTIGAAWTTEYGSSDNEKDFKNLYSYSPLHNITEGLSYPSTMVTTADHDDRVVPSHSFKYIATLQEKYQGSNPVLIRIQTKAGHGSGKPTSKIIEEYTDIWSFMFYNMGITPVY